MTYPVKAILVAGGQGSRLLPFTRYTHKTLLPLHQRPVIDYALGFIRRTGITDITIIGNQFIGQIAQHVGTGLEGENIHYVIEEKPLGVAQALNLARPHTQNCRLLVYFSDNITTANLVDEVEEWRTSERPGCLLLGRAVDDPRPFGVGLFDESGTLIDIIEKPENPPSEIAIGGIYLYDEQFWSMLDECSKLENLDFSITNLNKLYIRKGAARLRDLGLEEWLDCGTPDALLRAGRLAKEGRISPEPCHLRVNDPSLANDSR
jgi:glucose-1-phosphate thymidylyltransferase